MKNDIMNITKYCIGWANENDKKITNLQLQKLLYFIQQKFIQQNIKSPAFNEEIQAWNFGPVVPKVYNKFKKYRSLSIPYDKEIEGEWKNLIQVDEKKIIDSILLEKLNKTAWELVEETQQKGSAWDITYRKKQYSVITLEELYEK